MCAGLLANYYLLVNTAIRPALWSTTNSFIAIILISNILYLNIQAVLEDEDEMPTTQENIFYQYLDKKFVEEQKTPACSVRFVAQFIHESVLLSVQIGLVFIRSMLVKHGDNIRTDNCKVFQARLSFIGILVGILILTYNTAIAISLALSPIPLADYVLVRHCSGDLDPYTNSSLYVWKTVIVFLVLETLATYSCQVRIRNFRKQHNTSYFTKYRQNLATMDQLLFSTYTMIITAFCEAVIALVLLDNKQPWIEYVTFQKMRNIVNCVVIPCYWILSTRKDFKDLFSMRTCFWKRNRIYQTHSSDIPREPLEPREACFVVNILETSF